MTATATPPRLRLSESELVELTDKHRPSAQLEVLLRSGFTRARIGSAGRVILEREHYRAVCAGAVEPGRPVLNLSAIPKARQATGRAAR